MAADYNTDIQQLFLEIMMHEPEMFARVQNIYDGKNFHKSLRQAADFIYTYSMEYNSLPSPELLEANTQTKLEAVPNYDESHGEWFLDEFEKFTRQTALNRAIVEASDMIDAGDLDPVEKLITDAVQISLTRDLGIDYFSDPKARLLSLKDNNGQVSTGYPVLDRKLYGGFNKGELNIFAGTSGSGKSLVMQNLACNWVEQGLNGIYVTLELSEELCSMRMDSMLSGVAASKIYKNLDAVSTQIQLLGKNGKTGNLRVKYMPAQSNVNDIRAYVRELHIKTGKKPDFLLIDYLDLLMPVSAKVSPSDVFVKDKYVSEELRNLAQELQCLFVTASQLNRSAVEEVDFDHSMIAGGLSKINTADNVFGIFTSRAMREHGRYQLQLMKTRSSSGVGQKVELAFDIDTLRITDTGEPDEAPQGPTPGQSAMAQRARNGLKDGEDVDDDTGEITNTKIPKADVQSKKIQDMLNNLKKPK